MIYIPQPRLPGYDSVFFLLLYLAVRVFDSWTSFKIIFKNILIFVIKNHRLLCLFLDIIKPVRNQSK